MWKGRRDCRRGGEGRAAAKGRGQEGRGEGQGTGGERGGTGRAGAALHCRLLLRDRKTLIAFYLLLMVEIGFFFNVKYLTEDLSTHSSSSIHSTNIYWAPYYVLGVPHIGEEEPGPCLCGVLNSLERGTEINQIIIQMNVR